MPAVTAVGRDRQEEKDALERWADEVGISMEDLADQILHQAERAARRRSAAEASRGTVVSFGPPR